MSDIVERLRSLANSSGVFGGIYREAATAIEARDAEIARLRGEVDRHKSERDYIVGWNDGFEHVHGPLKFPTMLRKMWSGSEVQEWINQQRTEAARKLLAEEETERHKQQKADFLSRRAALKVSP